MASDDIRDELEAFSAEYRRSLPQRLHDIDALWAELRHGPAARERMHALLRALHSIKGSGTTFGMPRLSETAAAAEAWLEPFYNCAAMPEEVHRGEFDALLSALRASASS